MPEYRHAIDELRELLPRHVREDIASLPHVVATGIGPRRVDGRRTDEAALIVFVTAKQPLDNLGFNDAVPNTIDVEGGPIPTDVQPVGGGFRAMSGHPGTGSDTRHDYFRPFQGGIEVGRYGEPASSTARVTNEDGDSFVILSRHATGLERAYPEGEDIYSPTDVTIPTYRLGEVVDSSDWAYGTRWNLSDAALVEVGEDHASRQYVGIGNIDEAGRPDLDLRCVQCSAVDGIVGGEVLAEDVVVDVVYEFGTLTFEKLMITDLPGSPGSSGAVVAQYLPEEGVYRALGMHIAGSSGAGLVVPWNNLEREFDMRFQP